MHYKCDNCGAIMDRLVSECPYCGSMNYEGSIHEYNEALEDIREDLNDIPNEQKQDYYENINKEKNKVFKYILNTCLLCFILFALYFMVTSLFFNDSYEIDQEAYLTWQQENYDQLDTWFSEENYDAILEFGDDVYLNGSQEAISAYLNWDNATFISVLNDTMYIVETYESLTEEEIINYFLGNYLYDLYWCENELTNSIYNELQIETLNNCIDVLTNYFLMYFDIDEECLTTWKSEAYSSDGSIDWYSCQVIIEDYVGGNE